MNTVLITMINWIMLRTIMGELKSEVTLISSGSRQVSIVSVEIPFSRLEIQAHYGVALIHVL